MADKRTPSAQETVRSRIERHDLAALKKFGQNFLADKNVIADIVAASGVTEQDTVLEIGPGMGALTEVLADSARRVIAVEIDRGMVALLQELFADRENVVLIEGDILQQELNALCATYAQEKPLKVVANLPYYITTPVLMKLLQEGAAVDKGQPLITDITVMVQREVALRMQASPGSKDYGALSLAVQYYADCKKVLDVPPSAFYPPPKVHSAVVHLARHTNKPVSVADEEKFFALIRAAFNQRRKTFVNAVTAQWGSVFPSMQHLSRDEVKERLTGALNAVGVTETARAETLSLQEFADIYSILTEK